MTSENDASQKKNKRTRRRRRQLKVVFDTSVLYTGSASDLARQEIRELIQTTAFPDLEITWYLADIVRHERQYQMEAKARGLIPALTKLESLLDHRLNITAEILIERVDQTVARKQRELGLTSLPLDTTRVDWNRLILDASYRRPPFDAGEKEKGFRDALLLESFLQLVADSPKAPQACRLVLVTGDKSLTEATEARLRDYSNTAILGTVEELKGLINTLISEVDESFISSLKPKAGRLFFISDKEKDTLYYKEGIRERIKEQFVKQLETAPEGATRRVNGRWYISPPNFVRKVGQRIFWASRIEVETETYKALVGEPALSAVPPRAESSQVPSPIPTGSTMREWLEITKLVAQTVAVVYPSTASREIPAHKGRDSYEVTWSVEVTMARELRKPRIEEIKHIGVRWEPVA